MTKCQYCCQLSLSNGVVNYEVFFLKILIGQRQSHGFKSCIKKLIKISLNLVVMTYTQFINCATGLNLKLVKLTQFTL